MLETKTYAGCGKSFCTKSCFNKSSDTVIAYSYCNWIDLISKTAENDDFDLARLRPSAVSADSEWRFMFTPAEAVPYNSTTPRLK